MPDSKKNPWPQSVQVWDSQMLAYISDPKLITPSTEWREVAEYKLIRIWRVRHKSEWE
jgi:hypothetical protein